MVGTSFYDFKGIKKKYAKFYSNKLNFWKKSETQIMHYTIFLLKYRLGCQKKKLLIIWKKYVFDCKYKKSGDISFGWKIKKKSYPLIRVK
jgi:hypothetical protein